MSEINTVKEPLFHVVKRDNITVWTKILIYVFSTLIALFLGGVICSLVATGNPFMFFTSLFKGSFGTQRKIWIYLRDNALLLCVSMSLVPAFKMRFWNLGANGQVLMGALATVICMKFLGGIVSDGVLILIMLVASIVGGIVWALIPALLKVLFDTNETLLTLMMNYIATGLVTFFISSVVSNNSGVLNPIPYGNIPELGNPHLLIIIVGVVITAFMAIYLKFTKHGYELAVVGDSRNTAKYVGMNVKKVVLRTITLSGVICGIVGLLLVGAMSHTIGINTVNNMGFTGIMTTWLANCNPLFMIITCSLVMFITKGMEQVRMDFHMTNDAAANLIIGIVYFFIIACAFFIKYRVVFRKKQKNTGKESK